MQISPGIPAFADVRRIEASPSFALQFGVPRFERIEACHALGDLLPIGRKMTRPTQLLYSDRNGDTHECLGEAFDTTHNVLLLIYPVKGFAVSIIASSQYPRIFLGS